MIDFRRPYRMVRKDDHRHRVAPPFGSEDVDALVDLWMGLFVKAASLDERVQAILFAHAVSVPL